MFNRSHLCPRSWIRTLGKAAVWNRQQAETVMPWDLWAAALTCVSDPFISIVSIDDSLIENHNHSTCMYRENSTVPSLRIAQERTSIARTPSELGESSRGRGGSCFLSSCLLLPPPTTAAALAGGATPWRLLIITFPTTCV